jgi:hypothetical protein
MIVEITGLNLSERQIEAIRQAIKAKYTPSKVRQLNKRIIKAN